MTMVTNKVAERIVALTMGDPAGIGPEVVAKFFAEPIVDPRNCVVVIGDSEMLSREIVELDLPVTLREISQPSEAEYSPRTLNVIAATKLPVDFPRGVINAVAGRAAYSYIERAVSLAHEGAVDGICTAPIHKESLRAAGYDYPGHTEILAHLMRAPDCAMMLITPQLRTILVTIHLSLLDAIRSLSIDAELRAIRIADRALKKVGIARPRIAVAGLNPHAGEGGLFGREEIEIIGPAILQAQREGIDATGPYSGDTVFMTARRGRFDVVVAQYHDQGLIPVKLLGVEEGVNFTAGLPVIRTSVDHGTAFDIAGQGKADPSSLKAAVTLACELIELQKRSSHE